MVVVLALVAAFVSGSADYIGGRASKITSALTVNFYAQSVTAALLPIAALAIGWDRLHPGDLLLGAIGGVCGGLAFLVFFRALAVGRMSVIAPLAALTTALVPVVFDIVDGVELPPGRWIGVAVALIAIPALAFHRDAGASTLSLRRELLYAVVAGLGFAGFFVCIGHTSTDSGQWPVAFAAIGASSTMGILGLARGKPLGAPPRLALLAGLLMVASGLAINHALQLGPLAVATVLGSLYPLATTALANRFDKEPISVVNVAGIITAVAGAATIASYS